MYKLGDFKYVLNRTYNRDLANVFLVTSGDVSIWLMRRTRYARSLAVTSVVGYVLGLGDRHLSNILVSDKSGEVIHIDFGDCFEVAMKRKRFPEKIPFRLTKLLVNAMEVSGVEGSYRLTCNHTMRVLRNDFHSLMAMLEAFVHDPLVDWKLLSTNNSHFRNVLKQTLVITDRVQQKLTGSTLHDPRFCVSPIHQIDGLIREAQCAENICQMYGGWCPYW
jgi:FKBP12-rapamycin complex-associated protein